MAPIIWSNTILSTKISTKMANRLSKHNSKWGSRRVSATFSPNNSKLTSDTSFWRCLKVIWLTFIMHSIWKFTSKLRVIVASTTQLATASISYPASSNLARWKCTVCFTVQYFTKSQQSFWDHGMRIRKLGLCKCFILASTHRPQNSGQIINLLSKCLWKLRTMSIVQDTLLHFLITYLLGSRVMTTILKSDHSVTTTNLWSQAIAVTSATVVSNALMIHKTWRQKTRQWFPLETNSSNAWTAFSSMRHITPQERLDILGISTVLWKQSQWNQSMLKIWIRPRT